MHSVADLPPIDLGTKRPPPPSRTTKRNRSEDLDISGNATDQKKERTASPIKTATEIVVPDVLVTPAVPMEAVYTHLN